MEEKSGFSYEIRYTNAAEKFFKKHESVRKKYEEAVRELLTGTHPASLDLKRLRGRHNNYYRIRLGPWRVVYAVINGKIVVIMTLTAGSRGDVYKKPGGST